MDLKEEYNLAKKSFSLEEEKYIPEYSLDFYNGEQKVDDSKNMNLLNFSHLEF
jgi:hypothetical protein